MRWLIASSAWSWPMTRSPRCFSSVEHGRDLILHHLADRDAGPAGDHFADDLRVDADAHQRRLALQRVQFGVQLVELGAQRCRVGAGCAASRRRRRSACGRRAVFELARGSRGSSRPGRAPSPSARCSAASSRFASALAARRSAASRSAWSAPSGGFALEHARLHGRDRRSRAWRLRWPAGSRSGPAPAARRPYRARSPPCRAAAGPAR